MNRHVNFSRSRSTASLIAGVCLLALTSSSAQDDSKDAKEQAKSTKAASTNAENPLTIEVPKSEFVMPSSPQEGRDPFFPDRVLSGARVATSTNAVAKPIVSLVLHGISGKFALINGRTLEIGESADLTVTRGKAHVRLLSIREDSVTVEVDGAVQELKLRPGI